MTSTGSSLFRWQFPELEEACQSRALMIADPETVIADNAPPHPASVVDTQTGPALAELVQDQIARGYAEGWERGVAEGREQGLAEGRAAGSEEARSALHQQVERLSGIMGKLSAPIAALDAVVEEAVVALAIELARCVIGGETARSRDYLVGLIRQAVAKAPIEMGALRIVVNPDDCELIRAAAPAIEDGSTVLIGDEAVEPGDCRIFADGRDAPIRDRRWRPRAQDGVSQIDLSLATRWRAAMQALFEDEDS